jgi:ketosteroid isomerase-like protein
MDLWELQAREAIRDTVARYNANGDTGRFAHVIELFTDDAVMEVGSRVCTGRDEIITIFTSARDHRAGEAAPGYVRHFTSTHQIDLIDRGHANGRLYYQVLTDVGLDHWGRYVDRYRLDDGRWKFARRTVTVDGQSARSRFPSNL